MKGTYVHFVSSARSPSSPLLPISESGPQVYRNRRAFSTEERTHSCWQILLSPRLQTKPDTPSTPPTIHHPLWPHLPAQPGTQRHLRTDRGTKGATGKILTTVKLKMQSQPEKKPFPTSTAHLPHLNSVHSFK